MNLIADEDDMLDSMAASIASECVSWLDPSQEGCVLLPSLAEKGIPLVRRVVLGVLEALLDPEARVETATIDAVLAAFADGKPVSGYVANIQGNLAVSANKQGVRIEPMAAFRMRRKQVD